MSNLKVANVLNLGGTKSVPTDQLIQTSIRVMARLSSSGTILDSYGLASVTKTSTGEFTLVFSAAMPDVNYTALVCANYVGAGGGIGAYTKTHTTTGFKVSVGDSTSAASDNDFSALVGHST